MSSFNDTTLIVKYAREQFNDQLIQKRCRKHGDGEQEERETRGPKAKSAGERRKADKIELQPLNFNSAVLSHEPNGMADMTVIQNAFLVPSIHNWLIMKLYLLFPAPKSMM
jgi:hypothetical protein